MKSLDQKEPLSRPYETVLLAFVYFQEAANQEISLEQQSLVRIMMSANCPREAVAIKVLQNMVDEGFLQKTTDANPVYTRTQLGVESTPPPPPGPLPRTVPLN